jgi:electron transport complex protein RnfA
VIRLAILGVCASFAMNLLTQFGLGLSSLAGASGGEGLENTRVSPPVFLGLSGFLFFLWVLFSYVIIPLSPGPAWYLLLYPLCAVPLKGLDCLFIRAAASGRGRFLLGVKPPVSFCPPVWAEFLPLALLISLHLAPRPLEALVLALGFNLGLCLSLVILREIHRRSRFEAVPPFLRGGPLALISLGLLSLIFTSASIMFFNLFFNLSRF